ncbi:MAG: glutamine amidotransferase [Armatimonadetes bacterium]|nr:glutamine amidotransferase [Armatimonadota bacterium]
MLPLLVLRHVEWQGPGLLAEVAAVRGIEVRIADLPHDLPRWPEPADYAALVVLGGPMSVNDTQRYNWLKDEIRLLRRCMDEHLPLLGIGLGAQLLAAACGAKVLPGGQKEIGWGEVKLLPAGRNEPLFTGLPNRLPVFHWHGDTFDLPPDSRLLASSALYPHQAFRVGDRWYGLQFHLELTEGMPQAWAKEHAAELERTGGPTVGGDLADSDVRVARLRPHAEQVFHRWLDRVEMWG